MQGWLDKTCSPHKLRGLSEACNPRGFSGQWHQSRWHCSNGCCVRWGQVLQICSGNWCHVQNSNVLAEEAGGKRWWDFLQGWGSKFIQRGPGFCPSPPESQYSVSPQLVWTSEWVPGHKLWESFVFPARDIIKQCISSEFPYKSCKILLVSCFWLWVPLFHCQTSTLGNQTVKEFAKLATQLAAPFYLLWGVLASGSLQHLCTGIG